MGRPFFARPNRQKQLLAVRELARHSKKSEDSALGSEMRATCAACDGHANLENDRPRLLGDDPYPSL
jgi:hypothetical protein